MAPWLRARLAMFTVELPLLPGHGTQIEDMLDTRWADWSAAAESAYAELLFLPIMWPDFKPQTLVEAVEHYSKQERRFGMTSEQLSTHIQAFDPFDRPS